MNINNDVPKLESLKTLPIEQLAIEAERNINATVASAVAGWMNKSSQAHNDPIQPVKRIWHSMTSCFRPKKENDLLLEQLQQGIESNDGTGLGWFANEHKELEAIQASLPGAISSHHFQTRRNRLIVLLNSQLPNGELPLNFAIRLGKKEILRQLLAYGANPTMLKGTTRALVNDKRNNTVLDYVALSGDQEIQNILIDYFKTSYTALFYKFIDKSKFNTLTPQQLGSTEKTIITLINGLLGPNALSGPVEYEDPNAFPVANFNFSKPIADPLKASNTKIGCAAFILAVSPIKWGLGKMGRTQPAFLNCLTSNMAIFNSRFSKIFTVTTVAEHLGLKGLAAMTSLQFLGWVWKASDKYCTQALNTLTTTAIALSYLNLLHESYKNYKHDPKKAATAVTIGTLNLLLTYSEFFNKHLPESIPMWYHLNQEATCPKIF